MNRTRQVELIGALLIVATLLVYWPVLNEGFIGLDDADYVTENPHVLSGLTRQGAIWAFSSGLQGSFHPLTWLSHMLDVQLFGLWAGGHHLVNLFLHIANSLLIFLWLARSTGAVWRSAAVSALFALHPLHVEPVAWIASRKDVLSTFFFLLMLWAYLRYVELRGSSAYGSEGSVCAPPGNPESTSTLERRASASPAGAATISRWIASPAAWFGLTLLLFLLGLLSKPMVITAPFVLLLLDGWPLKRRVPFSRLVYEKIPLLCLGLLSSVVTFLWERVPVSQLTSVSNMLTSLAPGAARSSSAIPLAGRLTNAIASYVKYLGKTFWPTRLAAYYPHPALAYPRSQQWPGWQIALGLALLLVISGFVFRVRRRAPWLAVGWFWFIGTLVPVIGFVPVGYHGMADRYTYLPLIGLFISIVWAACELARRFWPELGATGQRTNRSRAAIAIAALLIIACGAQARVQVGYWRSDLDLFQHALAVTTDNAMAHYVVGSRLMEQRKYQLAMEHFDAGLKAAPMFAPIYYEAGLTFENLGNLEEALRTYRKGSELDPSNPWIQERLGIVLSRLGQREEAFSHYSEAVRLKPDFVQARYNLGMALLGRGEMNAAADELAAVLRLQPDAAEALSNLGELRYQQGQLTDAERCFRQLASLQPTNATARINLGGVLWRVGRPTEALEQYKQAVRLQPSLATAHFNLGTALSAQGRYEEAATEFAEATRLKPDYLPAWTAWGRALAGLNKFDRAQTPVREAVRLCPTNSDLHVLLGGILIRGGKTNEAEAAFATALQLEPDLVEKSLAGAKSFLAKGQTNAAITCINNVLLMKPDSAEAHECLGQILLREGKPGEAAFHLDRSARLPSRDLQR